MSYSEPGSGASNAAGAGRPFDHADEQAEPGYYRVRLDRYDTDVELTVTMRSGWQRYTFPSTGPANVLFNTGRANMPVSGSHVEIAGDRTVEGWVEAGGFCAGHDVHRLFRAALRRHVGAGWGSLTGRAALATAGGACRA